jgi:hypothetical protein
VLRAPLHEKKPLGVLSLYFLRCNCTLIIAAMLTRSMLLPLLMLLALAQGGQHYKNELKKPARKVCVDSGASYCSVRHQRSVIYAKLIAITIASFFTLHFASISQTQITFLMV